MNCTIKGREIEIRAFVTICFTVLLVFGFAIRNQAQNREGSNTKPKPARPDPVNILRGVLANRRPQGASNQKPPDRGPANQNSAVPGQTFPGGSIGVPTNTQPPATGPVNTRTPVPPDRTNTNIDRPGTNNRIPPNRGTNNATPDSPTPSPTPVANGNSNQASNTNAASTDPSKTDRGWPSGVWPIIVVLVLLIAIMAVGITLFKLYGPKKAPGNAQAPVDGGENIAVPPPGSVKIKPSADPAPKLELEGGELPTLETGISVELKPDPGKRTF
jgi:hypothetical protein